jgi:hypothetical protein
MLPPFPHKENDLYRHILLYRALGILETLNQPCKHGGNQHHVPAVPSN